MKLLRLPGNKVLSINYSAAIFQHKLNSQQASNLWYDAIYTQYSVRLSAIIT